jgi:branched-chain amino acid transport system permease protein
MLGAFATYWLVTLYHVDALLTLPISFALLFAFGWVLQYFLLNRTLGRPILLSLLVTFGISLILVNAALRLWSGDYRLLRIPYFQRSLILGEFIVPLSRVAACVVAVAMVAGLSWLLASTRLGRMIRATAQDGEMARMLGVNPRTVYAMTFGLGAGVSGVAGSLLAFYSPVEPNMGLTYTLFAFAVVVLGGLGYTAGVIWGGLALGIAQALTETYLEAGLSLLVAFALLYAILRFMPAGIMGKGRLE